MDSKRRHELSQNFLANWLITQYEEWIQPNSQWINLAILAVLFVICSLVAYSKYSDWSKAAAWRDYFTALSSPDAPAALEKMAELSPGPSATRARLSLGQIQLAEVCNNANADKMKSLEQLDKAMHNFQLVQKNAKEDDFVRQATWGLAQSHETAAAFRSDKNDLEEAAKEYKKLAERWPNELLGKRAEQQLSLITRPDTKKFYELAAAKAAEKPKADEFKVEIDRKDPFSKGPEGFGGASSILGGEFTEPAVDVKVTTMDEKAPAVKEEATKPEEPKKEEAKPEESKKEEPKQTEAKE